MPLPDAVVRRIRRNNLAAGVPDLPTAEHHDAADIYTSHQLLQYN